MQQVDTSAPELLDPITMPLTGHALIEASAGTGKTYTLAALYLRLLLGVGRENPLEVDKILVVTFTEAATQELRERIRTRIQEARIAFVLGKSDDHFIAQLLDLHNDHARAILDLEFAASEMDQAAIFTIHGFCQRMLKQHAFESGASFSAKLITDDSMIVRQALLDYWRTELYLAPEALAQEILSCYSTPDKLLSKIRSYLGLSGLILEPDYSQFQLAQQWQLFLKQQDVLREQLKQILASDKAEDDLLAIIANSSVDKRSYSKRYLPAWFNKLKDFCAGEKAPFKELQKFSQEQLELKCKNDDIPRHVIFEKIETFCTLQIDFKAVIFCRALAAVKINMQSQKKQLQQLSFDDLLSQLAAALSKDDAGVLAREIRQQYPFALIDEFQDTDPEQYAIFSTLYNLSADEILCEANQESIGLLMIGDPKQSIYAFRGADIFTYMNARRQVKKHFTLGTNWRSSKAMISAANQLFSRSPAPFIYNQDIPFYPVSAAKSKGNSLCLGDKPVAALSFWYTDKNLNNDQYLSSFAGICASQIDKMLKQGSLQGKPVTAVNIAVLVRDRREAAFVQDALSQLQVDSVFMSNRDNVYSTHIARELQAVLNAVNEPSNERYLRSALACEVFQLSTLELFNLNHDEMAWEALVEEFLKYRKIWRTNGVLAMLHALLQNRQLANRWLNDLDGERRLTDYLHLAELLQQASIELESNEALVRYLQERRLEPSGQSQEQQLRLDSDRSRVTLITIHKSKGLEYDLVYIPFACRYRSTSNLLFHNDLNQAVVDTSGSNSDNKERLDKEQLAEDLRLLYVAVTRAAHACFVGMANVSLRNKSVWHKTAIGYLLTLIKEDGQSVLLKEIELSKAVARLSSENSQIAAIDIAQFTLQQADLFAGNNEHKDEYQQLLGARKFSRKLAYDWRITSYSALSKHHLSTQIMPNKNNTVVEDEMIASVGQLSVLEAQKIDLEVINESQEVVEGDLELNIFSFPKGAIAGTFLHGIYEEIDFFNANEIHIAQVLSKNLPLSGYDLEWVPCISQFIYQSLHVLLQGLTLENQACSRQAFCLADIRNENRLVEMEFLLPFKAIHCDAINQLLQRYDPLAAHAGPLTFSYVSGMLKGFIDLTLRHDGRYYVVDYKSNYLGSHVDDYAQEQLDEAMIEHRYDFQYVLYTLALHRLLKTRIAAYSYDEYIGGAFYLFLRGMSVDSQTGVFFTKPKRQLIEQLDRLFEEGA
jgi:exodeoxyribonuclease V beta subunit